MYVPAIGVPTETPAEAPKDDAEPSSAPANNGKTTKNSDGSVTRTTVMTNPDGTFTTTTTRTYKDGSYTLKAVTRDSDDKVISTTESSVSFTSDGTKVEESKTTGSDGSARVFLEKTTKKGKVTSEETNTSAEGVVTIVMKTQKTDGTDVVKAFLKKSEGKVKLTSFKTNVSTAVIPASITANGKTYNVTMIGNNAMIDNDVIKTLKIGKNITSIGRNAFKSNDRLDTIVIYSTKIKDVGIYAIRGISPDAVVKIKSDKETFRSIRKKIRKSGADRSLTYKRLKVAAE